MLSVSGCCGAAGDGQADGRVHPHDGRESWAAGEASADHGDSVFADHSDSGRFPAIKRELQKDGGRKNIGMACPVGAQSGVLFYFPFSTDERDPTGRRTKIYPLFYGTFADIGIDPTVIDRRTTGTDTLLGDTFGRNPAGI